MTEYLLYSLLGKDPAFEEAVQHPKLLAIMEYFLGTDCVLNNCVSFIKKGGEVADEPQLGLHIDPHGGGSHGSHNALMQLSPYPDVFNSAWCLTDYTLENGAIVRAACFVLSPVARGVALTRKRPFWPGGRAGLAQAAPPAAVRARRAAGRDAERHPRRGTRRLYRPLP